jgi:hypothetical protein
MKLTQSSCLVLLVAALAAGCDAASDNADLPGGNSDVVDADGFQSDGAPGDTSRDSTGDEFVPDSTDNGSFDVLGELDPTDNGSTDVTGELVLTDDGSDVVTQKPAYMLIVTQDDLATVAGEWATYRRTRGFEVDVVTVTDLAGDAADAATFRDAALARLGAERTSRGTDARLFLMLLGDAPADGGAEQGRIPAHDCENTTPGQSGCWTDNRYVDLDGDRIPEIAAGRVPARTEAEARTVLAKVMDFESNYQVGEWNRRVSLYVGEAGFSPEIDGLLQTAMMEGLKRVNHAFDILGAWDNSASSYWYVPFNDKVVDLFNQGALMTVYVGHGSESWTQGLTTDQVSKINCDKRRPFSLFFACYAGNYASSKDSLAETLAFKADGPVASFGASDVSHPFGNAVLAYESQLKALEMRYETIGEVLVALKRGLVENNDEFRQFIASAGAMDTSCDTPEKQEEILRQHNDMYNLLGDPATSMQYPREIATFDAPSGTLASKSLNVSGTAPGIGSGTAIVSLETERDVILGALKPVNPDNPVSADVNANLVVSNDKTIAHAEVAVTNGRFQATLGWTADVAGGDYYLKIYAQDGTSDAIGVADFH